MGDRKRFQVSGTRHFLNVKQMSVVQDKSLLKLSLEKCMQRRVHDEQTSNSLTCCEHFDDYDELIFESRRVIRKCINSKIKIIWKCCPKLRNLKACHLNDASWLRFFGLNEGKRKLNRKSTKICFQRKGVLHAYFYYYLLYQLDINYTLSLFKHFG